MGENALIFYVFEAVEENMQGRCWTLHLQGEKLRGEYSLRRASNAIFSFANALSMTAFVLVLES
jgi:hypothetical protein